MITNPFGVKYHDPMVAAPPVPQLNLAELSSKLGPKLTDPAALFVETDAFRPDPAHPTDDPHRYTIYVPHPDNSRINIGRAHPSAGETGISLDTKSHIHCYTYADDSLTYLSLGAPPKTGGFDSNRATKGYSLQTHGDSTHIAKGLVTVASIEDSLWLLAKNNVRINSREKSLALSAEKDIQANADGNVNITAGKREEHHAETSTWGKIKRIGLVAFTAADFAGGAAFGVKSENAAKVAEGVLGGTNLLEGFADEAAEEWATQFQAAYSSAVNKTLTHIGAVTTMILGFMKAGKDPEAGESKWVQRGVKGASVAGDVAKELAALIKDFSASKTNASGDMNIDATKGLTINADKSVKVTAVEAVSLNGLKSASMTSTISSSVKGHRSASVWGGLGASLKALAGDVVVSSDVKGASISAKKDVKIASRDDKVVVTGDKNVQLNSVTEKAIVHGKTGAFFGAGDANGVGLLANQKSLRVGQLRHVEKFGETKFNKADGYLECKGGGDGPATLELHSGKESAVKVEPSLVDVKTPKFTVTAKGEVTIQGSRILLG